MFVKMTAGCIGFSDQTPAGFELVKVFDRMFLKSTYLSNILTSVNSAVFADSYQFRKKKVQSWNMSENRRKIFERLCQVGKIDEVNGITRMRATWDSVY